MTTLRHSFLIAFVWLGVMLAADTAHSQAYDTVRVMTYNLLNYPGTNSATRNPEFRKILRYTNPDILVVQEMISSAGVTEFLNNVLNSGQPGTYSAAPFVNGPDTDNAMFYKSSQFSYLDSVVLHTQLRDIVGYHLRPAGIGADSLDLRIYSAHLKASQGFEQDRLAEADTLRNHLNALPDGLFLMAAGDWNLYTSTEPAYQELIGNQPDNSGRLYDPANTPGSWHNDPAFAGVHTQSTRLGDIGDGGATGGLDDRFDFMLPSYAFQTGTRWHYVSGTYTEVGNDGNHFNQSINVVPNTAAPDSVVNALYVVSDHLPVYLDLYRPLSAPASLAILAPNGNEVWYAGNSYTLSWTSQNLSGTVSLKLNRNYPAGGWEDIITGTANDGSQPWTVTLPVSTLARVKVVSDAQPTVNDVSDGDFLIQMPNLTLTAPNGGEVWYVGQNGTISWGSTGITGNVRIELNRSYPGGAWETLYGSTVNDGSELWTVAGTATTQARLRISSLTNSLAGDTSSANFEIRVPWNPPVIVHDPHGDADAGLVTFTARVTDNTSSPATKLFYRQTSDAVFDSVAMTATGYSSEVAANVNRTFGRHLYFIRATDTDFQSSSTDTFQFVVAPECGLNIAYDDGTAEYFNWSEQSGFVWAVKFSPAQIPYALCSADIGVAGFHPDSSHHQIVVKALAADGVGGLPGTVLRSVQRGSLGNVVGGLPPNLDYSARVLLYDDSTSPLVLTGDFYISVGNLPGGTEAFGLDTSSVFANRSYFWGPCDQTWTSESASDPNARRGNRRISVTGWQDVPSQLVVRRSGDDIRLNWSRTGAPNYRVYKSLAPDGSFSDLIGTTADTLFVVSNAVQTDSRAFYRIQSSSSP